MKEIIIKPASGYMALVAGLLLAIVGALISMSIPGASVVVGLLLMAAIGGVYIVNPNEGKVLVLFGDYVGTVTESGFYWSNPFYTKTKISLKARNFETDKIKVNDRLGNPIVIGAVVMWRVADTAKARFEVDNYEQFVKLQSDTAIRHLAGSYSYDHFDDEQEVTLRGGGEIIRGELETELRDRLARAGVEVIEARITHLVYAEEIAHAMLQRQQATAVVAARAKIVEGAVGMVEMALHRLAENQVVELDEERKAAMVSNLLVVLCSDRAVSPVVNAGTLHH